ncbi:MAG: GTPase ObgE [Verrucomicrobia bacterium]|nr:MAG: GTPase ObgE [Verrucomicrobiota bacterium]PYK25129.1 MAG: GTPase ObgE [Verrucomicrobiota bacterium]PYK50581.1 MAG: GTPase ObgE [Verrucomicrobiota bacterium]
MFVDRIKIFAQAGKGGRGCVSFRREKFVPKGGPDGGDGGRGGDVILQADRHVDNLANLFYEPIVKAKNGGHGKGKKMAGRAGADNIVRVPLGTIVWQADEEKRSTPTAQRPTSNSEQSAIPIIDLIHDGQEFVLCRGGGGGKGNVHFKSSRNRAPRQYTEGEEGEEGYFLLELRTIADAGLVGYPNAGKSTLLRKISAARPKVAAYPFTTLHPIVGVIKFPGYKRATIADIPGLIEGAHQGVGLGHEFLRHITRCRILVFVIDVAGSEGRNPVEDLQSLRREIDLYDPTLSSCPWLVIANKMDLPDAKKNVEAVRERFPRIKIILTSAAKGEGMDALKETLAATMTNDRDMVSAGI